MKKTILFFSLAILLGIMVFFGISFYLDHSVSPTGGEGEGVFPLSGDTSGRFSFGTSSAVGGVATSTSTSTSSAPFYFTRDDVEKLVADMERVEADEQWYRLEKNDCFELLVLGDTPFFSAVIEKLPIEECQKRLKEYLMQRLNITAEQTCLLDLDVYAPDGNGSYRYDIDMGIPGCLGPKAVREWY